MYKNIALTTLLALIILCGTITRASAQTAKEDPIDVAYKACLLKDTSCANIGDCAFVAYGKWDKEMQHAFSKLLAVTKKEKDQAALKASQKAWEAYRDATFHAYDNMFNLPGNKFCLARHTDRIEMVRDRTMQLRNYIETFKKK